MAKLEAIIASYFGYLNQLGNKVNTTIGLASCILLGLLDLITPNEFVFSFFYLLPIAFTTWFAGKRGGILISVICTCFLAPNYIKLSAMASIWNILSTFGIFMIVTFMQDKIHNLLKIESNLSRTDPLTGAINKRAFLELVGYEMVRLHRESKPFSLAYLDIDDFKKVNDQYGHTKGDEVLKAVVSCLIDNLRKTDVVARMGGDEFTIFYPEIGQDGVKVATQRINKFLAELTMENSWPTSISMGVITSENEECKLDIIVTMADELMYKVKNAGKNNVMYSRCTGPGHTTVTA